MVEIMPDLALYRRKLGRANPQSQGRGPKKRCFKVASLANSGLDCRLINAAQADTICQQSLSSARTDGDNLVCSHMWDPLLARTSGPYNKDPPIVMDPSVWHPSECTRLLDQLCNSFWTVKTCRPLMKGFR